MRLWHESLIPRLPTQQLCGQHRECAALRGRGWGRRHSVVDYVFNYPASMLYRYHMLVIDEMERRGYSVDPVWRFPRYRGKRCEPWDDMGYEARAYPEHNAQYLDECIENLRSKRVDI